MPVPKRKRSRARRDKRFANKGIKATAFQLCSNCNNPLVAHQACAECGFYKGIKVLRTKAERSHVREGKAKKAGAKRAAVEEHDADNK